MRKLLISLIMIVPLMALARQFSSPDFANMSTTTNDQIQAGYLICNYDGFCYPTYLLSHIIPAQSNTFDQNVTLTPTEYYKVIFINVYDPAGQHLIYRYNNPDYQAPGVNCLGDFHDGTELIELAAYPNSNDAACTN